MYTPTNCHSASFDAMHAAFRHAAEAEARQPATALDTTGLLRRSRTDMPRHLGRVIAALAGVLIAVRRWVASAPSLAADAPTSSTLKATA